MNEEKEKMLSEYIHANISPILIEGISSESFPTAVIIPSDCSIDLLNGHYEETDFVPPEWYKEIKRREKEEYNILLIDDITKIKKEDQFKFGEILKYRKINNFNLPDNCVVILTAEKVNKELISEDVYSLVVHI